MIFRQLLDGPTGTQTYLLADQDSREAVLIDSVFEQHLRDLALIRELNLNLLYTLETHVHADHVTGAWLMKQALGSKIALAKTSGAEGSDLLLVDGDECSSLLSAAYHNIMFISHLALFHDGRFWDHTVWIIG